MQNVWLFRLISITSVVGVLVFFYILFPERTSDNAIIITVVLLSLSVGFTFYSPVLIGSKRSDTSRIGSIGPLSYFTTILLAWTIASTYIAFLGHSTIAVAMSCLTITGFAIILASLRVISNTLDTISQKVDYNSNHAIWANHLQKIALSITDSDDQKSLLKLSDESKYLARDYEPSASNINDQITTAIDALDSLASTAGKKVEIDSQIAKIRSLFASRETQLKDKRSKV